MFDTSLHKFDWVGSAVYVLLSTHTLHFDSVKFVEACVKLEKRRLFNDHMIRGP
jgi:hypothetical protein